MKYQDFISLRLKSISSEDIDDLKNLSLLSTLPKDNTAHIYAHLMISNFKDLTEEEFKAALEIPD